MGRLNKEDLIEMEKMLHSGSSAGDIASRFGITTQAVYSRMGNVSSPRKLLIHNRKLMKDIEEMKIVLAEILLELNRKRIKPFKPEDKGKPDAKVSNLLENLKVISPNTAWASDFTYLKYENSFLYVATFIDILAA